MAQFVRTRRLLPDETLERFKYEIANEIGIGPQVQDGYWGEVPSRDCGRVGGKIGGNMVRVMIRYAEEALSQNRFPTT